MTSMPNDEELDELGEAIEEAIGVFCDQGFRLPANIPMPDLHVPREGD